MYDKATMDGSAYEASIKLTSFMESRIINYENADGVTVRGVFIPLEANNLKEYKSNVVIAKAFINPSTVANSYGWTHYIQMKGEKSFVQRIKDLGYKGMPILGNLRKTKFAPKYVNNQAEKVKVSDYE